MGDKNQEPVVKVPLILFSGGLDSSYLLEEMMMKGDVEVLYAFGGNNTRKAHKEQAARVNIIRTLERRTGNKVRDKHEVHLHNLFCHHSEHLFQQPLMWLNAALQVSDSKKHSELLVGYVAGDQISSLIPDLEQAWMLMQRICKENSIPLRFPLKLITKKNILDGIGIDIVQKVWICENPIPHDHDYKACKQCVPCLTIAGQLHMWELANGKPYSRYLIEQLNIQKSTIKNEINCEQPPSD